MPVLILQNEVITGQIFQHDAHEQYFSVGMLKNRALIPLGPLFHDLLMAVYAKGAEVDEVF